jgi:hypothetical protein
MNTPSQWFAFACAILCTLSTIAAVLARWDARKARLALDIHLSLWRLVNMPPEVRKLAEAAVEACKKREAELEAMSPEDRQKAIEAWAHKLAEDTAGLND